MSDKIACRHTSAAVAEACCRSVTLQLIDGPSTTLRCQCHVCLLARLHGITSVLACGRTSMAASILQTVLPELEAFVAVPPPRTPLSAKDNAAAHRDRPVVTDVTGRPGRAAKLAKLLSADPALREIAAAVLKARPHDVDAIARSRVLLSPAG